MILEGFNVKKYFGGIIALRGVDFKVKEGEILGLIGPNGAGKTTLFNIICGFYKPTDGIIKFNGIDITKLRPSEICHMGIGRTFQIVRPFTNLTVLENVMAGALFGKKKRIDLDEAKKKALEYLEFVGLIHKKDFLMKDLNLIERKFVEIARALATDPRILLLDEPLAGLNPVEISEASMLIRRIRDELGITVFWIEHVMRAIMKVAERIIVLNYGEKIAEGPPEKISKDPNVIKAYLGRRAI